MRPFRRNERPSERPSERPRERPPTWQSTWRSSWRGAALLAAVVAGGLPSAGCRDRNLGLDPPNDQFFFPSGLLVDPTPEARWLYIASANSDLKYNAGTLSVVDLSAFWDAWFDEATQAAYPFCESGSGGRCVQGPGGDISDGRPCRRSTLKPSVVECDEGAFIDPDDTIHTGDFGTVLAASQEPDGDLRLWLPVRGDPSITFIDVERRSGGVSLSCDQGNDPDELDKRLCGDDHRLKANRNDESLRELSREPFNMLITRSGDERLAVVAHSDDLDVTLIALDGVYGGGPPAIVDQFPLFQAVDGPPGGFGLAERPCFAAEQGPLGEGDPEENIPSLTEGCTRPLLYAGYRNVPRLASFTASSQELSGPPELVDGEGRVDCFVGGEYVGPYCATPDQLGQPCAVLCEPRVRAERTLVSGGLLGLGALSLGDIAFADDRGDTLIVLQTSPGALLFLDTSLGDDTEPLDQPSSPPIEVCAEPTRMQTYVDDGQRFAFVSCFRAALLYVVDIDARRVVDTVVTGTGPHDLTVDPVREVVYVANTLESSLSVIDISRHRATRFQELARLGLPEPFER